MTRLALIINGYSKTEEEKKSDILFVQSYYYYFNSIAGGAWEADEIMVMDEPEFEYIAYVTTVQP